MYFTIHEIHEFKFENTMKMFNILHHVVIINTFAIRISIHLNVISRLHYYIF